MGAEAARRINGPWDIHVDFPDRFSKTVVPESFDDITDSVEVLTPPTPMYGGVEGGTPIGLRVYGAGFRGIELPVFEWTGYETSLASIYPLRNQHYFALENIFQGDKYRTSRVTIGKVAILEDVTVCAMPVKVSRLSKSQETETAISSQPTVEASIARAVFNILNGETELDGSYNEWQNFHKYSQIKLNLEARQLLQGSLEEEYDEEFYSK
jgi:hypothetical protein